MNNIFKITSLSLVLALCYCSDHTHIVEKFYNVEFMGGLAPRVDECKAKFDSSPECDVVEYLSEIVALQKKLLSRPRTLEKQIPPYGGLSEVPYKTQFENFVILNKIFKGIHQSSSMTLSQCIGEEHQNDQNNIYSLKDCVPSDSIQSIQIPSIATNSYSIRFPPNSLTYDEKVIDTSKYWPTLIPITSKKGDIQQCPLGMHMVVWGATQPITARVFHSSGAYVFGPEMGDKVLHYTTYKNNNGFPSNQIELPPFTDITLDVGEFLFVPNNFLVAFKLHDDTLDGSTGQYTLLQTCFYDASNVNEVRDALEVEAMISPVSRVIYNAISSPSLFSFAMERDPKPLTFALWLEGKGNAKTEDMDDTAKSAPTRDRAARSNFKDWQEVNRWNSLIASLSIPRPHTPVVTSLGRKNVTVEWTSPYVPETIDKTKFGFNITICDATVAAKDSFHAETDCKHVEYERSKLTERVGRGVGGGVSRSRQSYEKLFSTTLLDLAPSTSYVLRSTIFYGESSSKPSPWTSVFATRPETPPAAIERSVVATENIGDPTRAVLTFRKPTDDGGFPIMGYHVYSRHTAKKHLHTNWVWNGLYDEEIKNLEASDTSIVRFEVHNLIPGTTYEFQVASVNKLGNSSLSQVSAPLRTPDTPANPDSRLEIFGRGHGTRIKSAQWRIGMDHSDVRTAAHVTVDDSSQTLYVDDINGEKFHTDVWDCHWSPKLFRVTGEVAWTYPPFADGDLSEEAKEEVVGRIAIVLRGKVPISHKALSLQRAGAIGCIIIDDGRCTSFDQKCVPGSTKAHGDRFAMVDDPSFWKNLRIPVVLVHSNDISSLLNSTGLSSVESVLSQYEAYLLEKTKAAKVSSNSRDEL